MTGRQRYFARQWHVPEPPCTDPSYWTPDPVVHWTDYLGEQPYVDCEVELDANDIPVVTEQTRYLAGFGVHAQQDAEDPNTPVWYLHGDLLRSAMLLTDEAGQATETLIYTAFGEPVTPDGAGGWRVGFPPASETRYQYAAGWGYESGLITLYGANPDLPPITLQHVGYRWYDRDWGGLCSGIRLGSPAGGIRIFTARVNRHGKPIRPA